MTGISALTFRTESFYTQPHPLAPAIVAACPFDPLFRNPHLQTIAGRLWARDGAAARYPLQSKFYQTESDVSCWFNRNTPLGLHEQFGDGSWA